MSFKGVHLKDQSADTFGLVAQDLRDLMDALGLSTPSPNVTRESDSSELSPLSQLKAKVPFKSVAS